LICRCVNDYGCGNAVALSCNSGNPKSGLIVAAVRRLLLDSNQPIFANREIYREIVDFVRCRVAGQLNTSVKLMICGKIPCSAKQGIFCDKQGISGAEQGNLFAASVNDPTGEVATPPPDAEVQCAGVNAGHCLTRDFDNPYCIRTKFRFRCQDIARANCRFGPLADMAAYSGPCTPPNTQPHHYSFVLIATDFDPKELSAGLTREELTPKFAPAPAHVKGVAGIVGLFVNPWHE
jgi:hypothetical protein